MNWSCMLKNQSVFLWIQVSISIVSNRLTFCQCLLSIHIPWYAKGSDLRHVESLLKALAVSSCHKSHSLESPTFAPATKELGFFKIRVLAWKGEPLDSVFQADSTRVPEPPAVWLPHPGTHHSSHQVQQNPCKSLPATFRTKS